MNSEQVAGYSRSGSSDNQLHNPSDVIVHKETDSLIICDRGNQRVVQWPRQNGKNGKTIISNVKCTGLATDKEGFIYVSDTYRHKVTRWRIGENTGTVIAGGNQKGSCNNQLASPEYIFVDQDCSLYVSEWSNHRVTKWEKGSKEGILVAGGNGEGRLNEQLFNPAGVVVDRLGTIYVADGGNNRIMRWQKGDRTGSVVADEQTDQLKDPVGLSLDQRGNLYVVDRGNNRVLRFQV